MHLRLVNRWSAQFLPFGSERPQAPASVRPRKGIRPGWLTTIPPGCLWKDYSSLLSRPKGRWTAYLEAVRPGLAQQIVRSRQQTEPRCSNRRYAGDGRLSETTRVRFQSATGRALPNLRCQRKGLCCKLSKLTRRVAFCKGLLTCLNLWNTATQSRERWTSKYIINRSRGGSY